MKGTNDPVPEEGSSSEKEEEWILDPVRRKRVRSTPEERVRQSFMRYLNEEKGHPYGLMEVEKGFRLHKRYKRCDILTRDGNAEAFMIVECKAPEVAIDQEVFDQVARYNIAFEVPYLVVTNGHEHYACRVGPEEQELHFLNDIPSFQER